MTIFENIYLIFKKFFEFLSFRTKPNYSKLNSNDDDPEEINFIHEFIT